MGTVDRSRDPEPSVTALATPDMVAELGPDLVVRVVTGTRPLSRAEQLAVRAAARDGQVVAGRGNIGTSPASVVLALIGAGVLTEIEDSQPLAGGLSQRTLAACRREWERRRHGGVSRDVVVEYLAALDVRRDLAIASAHPDRLRGQALTNAVRGAQTRLERAEKALRETLR